MELRDYVRLAEKLSQKREKIEISLHSLAGPEEQVIYGLLTGVLGDIGQLHLENTVQLVLGELLRNAEAVILAEAYLKTEGKPALDSEFRTQMLENRKTLRKNVPAKGAAGIIFESELSSDSLVLSVSNRGGLDEAAVQSVEQRLELAGRQKGIEGLADLPDMDTSTGRGLGLVVSILSLRNVGISRHLFYYQHSEKRTTFTFEVPVNLASQNKLKEIETGLIAEVKDLPSLPEQLNRIMQLCDSPDSSIKQIAGEIQRDQTIAGQLIKLANSGGFAGGRIVDLEEAVKVVGLKHISQFLLQIGSFNILIERYGESSELTEHPMRVGYFSRSLARRHERGEACGLRLRGRLVARHRQSCAFDFDRTQKGSRAPCQRSRLSRSRAPGRTGLRREPRPRRSPARPQVEFPGHLKAGDRVSSFARAGGPAYGRTQRPLRDYHDRLYGERHIGLSGQTPRVLGGGAGRSGIF